MNIPDKLQFSWQELSISDIAALIPVREQLHYAVQFIAAAGKYLTDPKPDDSHTSLSWHQNTSSFIGQDIENEKPYRFSLKPATLELGLCDAHLNPIKSIAIDQKSREDILDWMKISLSELSVNASTLRLEMHYDIPDHPIAHGNTFEYTNPEYFNFFSKVYSNADSLLTAIMNSIPESSIVLCWPHHFDIATLISLDADKDPEHARSIGIGLSPGDSEFEHPYFYISPWPYPDKSVKLPDADGPGTWHTKSWTGRLLELPAILGNNAQQKIVEGFVIDGLKLCLQSFN
jgi:hypothetical protein